VGEKAAFLEGLNVKRVYIGPKMIPLQKKQKQKDISARSGWCPMSISPFATPPPFPVLL
jgi:hypothetical protein